MAKGILRAVNLSERQFSAWDKEQDVKYRGLSGVGKDTPYIQWGIQDAKEIGAGNLYPNRVAVLFQKSPYYRRIASNIQQGVAGEGLSFSGDQSEELQAYFLELGITDTMIEQLAWDIALFNGCALQAVWSRGAALSVADKTLNSNTGLSSVRHVKLSALRVAKPPEGQWGNATAFYFSADWDKVNSQGKAKHGYEYAQPERIPAFNKARPDLSEQILWSVQYSPISDYYPLPDVESVYEELELQNSVTLFQRRYVENGMVSSAIITYPYTPSVEPGQPLRDEDEQAINDIQKNLETMYAGQVAAGKPAIIIYDPRQGPYIEGEDTARPEFKKPVESNNDQRFLEVFRENRQSVFSGLGAISPDLFGLPSASGFTSQEGLLLTAQALTEVNIYRPKRKLLLRALAKIAETSGYDATVDITPASPIQRPITEAMVSAGIVSLNEFRAYYGLPEVEGGDAVGFADQQGDGETGPEIDETTNPS